MQHLKFWLLVGLAGLLLGLAACVRITPTGVNPSYVGDFYRPGPSSSTPYLLPWSKQVAFTVTDRQFGALHNGVPGAGYTVSGTDDTAAIQKAIDAALAAGGGTVYFP